MQTLGPYDVGDKPTFTATFRDLAGDLGDPTAVVFLWKVPAGTETAYTFGVADGVANPSTGVYTFTPPTIAAAGDHQLRAKGTGALVAAVEATVGVQISNFTTP